MTSLSCTNKIEGIVGSIMKSDNLAFSACWHQEMAMTACSFQHLTLDERRSLFRMQEARLGVTETAARLGRHRSTIYGELGRNRFHDPDASRDSRRNSPATTPSPCRTSPAPVAGAWPSLRGTRSYSSTWWTGCARAGRRSRSQGGSGRKQRLTRKKASGSTTRRSMPRVWPREVWIGARL